MKLISYLGSVQAKPEETNQTVVGTFSYANLL